MSLQKLLYRAAIYGAVTMVMIALEVPSRIKNTLGL